MRGRRRILLSYKQTHAQSGPWESAMREQVSLFTCGSRGGLNGKYPHHCHPPPLNFPCVGSSWALHLDGEVGKRWVGCSHRLLTAHGAPQMSSSRKTKCKRHHSQLSWDDTKMGTVVPWLPLWILLWTSYAVIIDRAEITGVTANKTAGI